MTIDLQPRLEDERILLEPLQMQDFDALYKIAADPQVWAQHPSKDRWKRAVFTKFFAEAMSSGGAFRIIDKNNGEVIGSTRYYHYDPGDRSIFIGFTFFSTAYWGTGINPQVKGLMLRYIFQFVEKVGFHVGSQNIRSQIAVLRLGAIKVREEEVKDADGKFSVNFVYELEKHLGNTITS